MQSVKLTTKPVGKNIFHSLSSTRSFFQTFKRNKKQAKRKMSKMHFHFLFFLHCTKFTLNFFLTCCQNYQPRFGILIFRFQTSVGYFWILSIVKCKTLWNNYWSAQSHVFLNGFYKLISLSDSKANVFYFDIFHSIHFY